MASCQTGEETTDAEMRVYCAYSLPAVILLFGGANWEKDGLKRCFLELIGRIKPENGNEENGAENSGPNIIPPGPPLPVKRCLASSVHAVAHMLGPDVVSKDPAFLSAFEKSFLRDPDEAIRLNILKNLASFLGALPPGDGAGHRNAYLPMLQSIIMGDDVLGAAKRRSASNPGVLNWRQRDAVARVLPDLIVLFDAQLNRQFMWPILKALLTDSVSAVRENAGWSVPVLLRKYTSNSDENEMLTCLSEVTTWLRETFLGEGCDSSNGESSSRLNNSFRQLKKKKQMASSEGAFSKRQGYCRILAAVSLAMRMGEGGVSSDDTLDITSQSNGKNMPHVPVDPYGVISQYERDQFRVILLRDLLPPALEMAVDCVANVRLTLTKCLKVLPPDVRQEGHVEDVLSTLEEELLTWDVGDMPLADSMVSGIQSSGVVGGGAASSSDPPAVTMTSTMSSC
jgi:serine/threonine-protein phosphatase 4 regulatory subunit 1